MDLRYKVKYIIIVIGCINNSCMLMQIQHPVNQKSVPPGNLPTVVTPIFYELYQKKRDYDEFCCRSLSQSHLAGVASNYAYALFGIGQFKYNKGHHGKVCIYKYKYCNLQICSSAILLNLMIVLL